jgi:hypothetical protein
MRDRYAGAAYLIFLGIKKLVNPEPPVTEVAVVRDLRRVFTQGVIVNVLNPQRRYSSSRSCRNLSTVERIRSCADAVPRPAVRWPVCNNRLGLGDCAGTGVIGSSDSRVSRLDNAT